MNELLNKGTPDRPSNGRKQQRSEAGRPIDLIDLAEGDVLYERHRRDCFVVSRIDREGIGLRQRDTDFYIPHSLFLPWYGSRLFHATETTTLDLPAWVEDDPAFRWRVNNRQGASE